MVYSDYVKQRIVYYYEKKFTYGEIVKALEEENIKVCKSGVWTFLRKFRKSGSIERKKGSGRPTKLSDEIQEAIEGQMNDDDETTTKELTTMLQRQGCSLSNSSVRRYRQQLGWTYRRSAYCQLIRDGNKVKRLEWAKKYIEEGSNGFRDVIFTDETSVQLDCYRRFSYRKAGSLPRPKPRYMLYYNHFTCYGLVSTKSWWEWLSHNLKLVHSNGTKVLVILD